MKLRHEVLKGNLMYHRISLISNVGYYLGFD